MKKFLMAGIHQEVQIEVQVVTSFEAYNLNQELLQYLRSLHVIIISLRDQNTVRYLPYFDPIMNLI